ncbi:MAG TPA: hypothetical protein VFE41_16520 [Acetobacteraceae bacterium]|nr:hypothetical protein [Acetobacteraceae bacterium]
MTLTIDRATRRTLLAEAIATLEAGGFVATEVTCARLLAEDPWTRTRCCCAASRWRH